jgi:hypothetical protein
MEFHAETYQNEFLPTGGTSVDAIVTVAGRDGPGPFRTADGAAHDAAVVVVIDVSGSMEPRSKIEAARQAAITAVESLRDGVLFGVIGGNHRADYLYPAAGLARAGADTRAAASVAIRACPPSGGTAMGRWLVEARVRLIEHPNAIRNVILLTDGRNESESDGDLRAAVAMCDGVFQCDCRGVGVDWSVDQLRTIASALLGSVDIIPEPGDMPADFAAITARAMAKREADVTLRLSTPRGTATRFVKQVSPTIDDLTSRAVTIDERTVEVPTGAWGDEERDYHIGLSVPAQDVGEEMLAGRVNVIVDGEVVARSQIRAVWTDDLAASTRISPHVAHYTGQAELASSIADGLAARAAGDDHTATVSFARAAQLAAQSGHTDTLRLLAGVVDIEDASAGTVRLRPDVDAAQAMALDTRSTRTTRSTVE